MGSNVSITHETRIFDLSKPEYLPITSNLTAAKFELMKFTPAKRILDDALERGVLKVGGEVYESSSGTFALALSILCAFYGLRLTLVTGPISDVVRWRLENLGANIHIVNASNNCLGGIQQARLDVLKDLLNKNPRAFWPRQYTNPLNAQSYQPIAKEALSRLGSIDTVVGTVGSGGSLFGISEYLKKHNDALRVVAVDHNRSVIFGANAQKITRMCRETFEQILAMGAGIPMGNVCFEECDEVHWVPVPKMVQEVHKFHNSTGYLVGPSSGAALTVAQWYAEKEPQKNVLTILPDHGVRYADTLFSPEWINQWPEDMARKWSNPEMIENLNDVTENWCRLMWSRRCFKKIKGHDPEPRALGYNP